MCGRIAYGVNTSKEISATETPEGPTRPSALHVSKSAERALTLLDTVVTDGSMSLGEAASVTDMATSTALRHLRALAQFGYLVRDELGRFSVGPTFLRIALAAFRSGPYARLTAAAQPHLDDLSATTEESAYLAVRDGTMAVYIATVESPRAIRHVGWVGQSVPVEGTAIGAALTTEPRPPGHRPEPHFNTGAIESDVGAVTAAVFGPSGVLGAFSILGPAERLAGRRLGVAADALVDAATDVALQLSSPDLAAEMEPS